MAIPDLAPAVAAIRAARATSPADRALLVALSGIDGSGKGYVTRQLAQYFPAPGPTCAVINIDGWLNLPHVRFSDLDPARHFYDHAIRFDALFEQLILPLRANRSVRVEADFTEETAQDFRKHVYEFANVDIILLEGIFLLKKEFVPIHDLTVWIECSFATALERAIARGQEGLSREETIAAYRRIYFPAQEIHFERDRPQAAAHLLIANETPQEGRG